MPAALELAALGKRYGSRPAVLDLTLGVPEGCMLGFLGPNGAGKTTTIRILLGLLRPDAGRATILGRDCWRDSRAVKIDVGYLPGDLRLPPWMCGRDALALCGQVRRRDLGARGRELARALDLDLGVRVAAMSRGMRQKLGLIVALAHDPRLLLLDEPTTGLDPLTQVEVFALLRQAAARGATVLFSSHVLSEVQDLCERVVLLRRGRLVVDARLDELRARAGRAVAIRWGEPMPDPSALPVGLTLLERQGRQWRCGWTRPVPELLAWLHGRPLVDLTLGAPDLEAVFRGFYAGEDP